MKAICIYPLSEEIKYIFIKDDQSITDWIGDFTLAVDGIGNGDVIHFDKECFVRYPDPDKLVLDEDGSFHTDSLLRQYDGKFKINNLPPISGNAVITGNDYTNVNSSVKDIEGKVEFLSEAGLPELMRLLGSIPFPK